MTEVKSAFSSATPENYNPDSMTARLLEPYNVPEWVGFDGILSSQWNTTEDDEDEDEVGEVGVVNEVVAGDS